MRGGLIAYFGTEATSARLEQAVDALRWHSGEACELRHGQLHVVCLVDPDHGPWVSKRDGVASIVHGAPAGSVEVLQKGAPRFVALESDGTTLRVARDTSGHVPLFYRRLQDGIWWATEVHPLLAIGAADPDLSALAAFAATVEYPERTGWQGIHRVLPGEILTVEANLSKNASRYWTPALPPANSSLQYGRVVERFRELWNDAVKRTLSARVGVVLSGGLDSSAVAVTAAQACRPVLASVVYPSLPQVDELKYASAVADRAGRELHQIDGILTPWDPIDELKTFGIPPVMLPTGVYHSVLPALVDLGCDVALDGHDGDGALGNTHAELANTVLDGRFRRLAEDAREEGWRSTLRATVMDFAPPSALKLALRKPYKTTGDHYLPYFREPVQQRIAELYRWRPPRAGWRREQIRVFLPPATQINEETEALAARLGIDIRHPFADPELVEFLVALPHSIKGSTAQSKRILRDALGDLLPENVAQRSDKTEFSSVIDRRVDYERCFTWVRDSGVRLPAIDYGRLFRDASKPQNSRVLWSRLARVHLFVAGAGR